MIGQVAFTAATSLALAACATQAASNEAISSIRSGFSERRSTLARASVGMQLMLVPPWINPKLKEDRGAGSLVASPAKSAEVNCAITRLSA